MKAKFEFKDTGIILYKNFIYKYFFHFDSPDEDIEKFFGKNTSEVKKKHDLIFKIKELVSILPNDVIIPKKITDLIEKNLNEITESIEDLIDIIKELLLLIKENKNKIAEEQKKENSKQQGHDSGVPHR